MPTPRRGSVGGIAAAALGGGTATPPSPPPRALSAGSAAPWVPPPSTADPPWLLHDFAYSLCSLAALLACGVSARFAVLCAAALLAALRALPPLSLRALEAAEAALLATVRGDVRHHWSDFTTASARWRIHALSLAPAPAARGKVAIIVLHGHSSSAALWESVLDGLSTLGPVYALDLPGWGRSPAPPALLAAHSPEAVTALHVELLAGWAAANGLARVVLVGHSLGGFFALHTAARHPTLVAQLVLVSPAGVLPVASRLGGLGWALLFRFLPPQRIARRCGRLGYAAFRAAVVCRGGRGAGAIEPEDPRFPAFYYQLAFQTGGTGPGDAVAGRFMRLGPRGTSFWWARPALAELLALRVPLAVIWGQRDELIDPCFAPLLHRILPRTDVYIVKGAEHNPAHSSPAIVRDAIRDAVIKQRSGGARRAVLPGDGAASPPRPGNATSADQTFFVRSPRRGGSGVDGLWLGEAAENGGGGGGDGGGSTASRASPLPAMRRRGRAASSPAPIATRRCSGVDGGGGGDGDGGGGAGGTPGGYGDADDVGGDAGGGRGICHACQRVVVLRKSYWHCACAAWSFNGHASEAHSLSHFDAQVVFLDELYVRGDFNAQTSRAVVLSRAGSSFDATAAAAAAATSRGTLAGGARAAVASLTSAPASPPRTSACSPSTPPRDRGELLLVY